MSDRFGRDSEGAPVSSAPHASASEPGAPAEDATLNEHPTSGEPANRPDPENEEARLEQDLDELAARAHKADEYLELAKRTKADFENYRKRAARESALAQERGVGKLARELLPAVDSLYRALEAAEATGSDDELVSGIKLVQAELLAALNRVGVELFSPEGERFDPERHEAVAQQPFDGAQPGTVVEVYQQGCRLGDTVIRPARVVVAG
jgi:molecular chaperone GrpE